jgi:hypothetical protein
VRSGNLCSRLPPVRGADVDDVVRAWRWEERLLRSPSPGDNDLMDVPVTQPPEPLHHLAVVVVVARGSVVLLAYVLLVEGIVQGDRPPDAFHCGRPCCECVSSAPVAPAVGLLERAASPPHRSVSRLVGNWNLVGRAPRGPTRVVNHEPWISSHASIVMDGIDRSQA